MKNRIKQKLKEMEFLSCYKSEDKNPCKNQVYPFVNNLKGATEIIFIVSCLEHKPKGYDRLDLINESRKSKDYREKIKFDYLNDCLK